MNNLSFRAAVVAAAVSASIWFDLPSATAAEWQDPGSLIERIVSRAPAVESDRLRAQSMYQMGDSASSQLADTTLQIGGAILPIETRNGPIRAQFTAMQMLPQFRARTYREAMYGFQANEFQCVAANRRLELRVATLQRLVAMGSLQQIQDSLEQLRALALDAVDTTVAGSAHDIAEHSDVLQAELVVHEIENQQIQIRRQLEEHRAVLAVWADDQELEVSPQLLVDVLALTDAVDVMPGEHLDVSEHPALHEFDAREAASRTQSDALLASRRTQVAFMVQWSILTGLKEMNPEREGRDALMLGFQLTLPTANREARFAAEAASVQAESTRYARQAALERLQAQAAELAERYTSTTEEWKHIESTLIPVATDRVEALVDELAHGRNSYDNLIGALETSVRLTVEQWQTWNVAAQSLVQLDATLNGTFSLTPWNLAESCSAVTNGGEQQ